MTQNEWKQYYMGMVKQGIRPRKVPEMIERCGRNVITELVGGKPMHERRETEAEATARLTIEINTLRKQLWKEV